MKRSLKNDKMKTYAEINEKIKKGTAVVLTAEEVSELSKTLSPKEIAEKVDIAVETVKKQKQIARKILKEKFGKLFLFLPAVLFS